MPQSPMTTTFEDKVAPAGVRLTVHDGMGRELVADRDFEPGEVLFVERPLVTIPKCTVGEHTAKGTIMTQLADRWPGQAMKLDMDLLCKFFVSCSDAVLTELQCLESHSDSTVYLAKKIADDVASMAVAQGILADSSREAVLAKFLLILAVNAHSVPCINGVALFFWMCMLTHSCDPNATVSKQFNSSSGESIKAAPRALSKITAGEVITISYLSLQMGMASTPVRQELLRLQKNFVCRCQRCSAEDIMRALPCPKCSAFCHPLCQSEQWMCSFCPVKVDRDVLQIAKEEQLINFILTFDHENDEQTIHSLINVVNSELGRPESAHAEHFLWAWLQLALVKALLKPVPDASKKDIAGNFDRRPVERAFYAFLPLLRWTQDRVPSCFHLLAMECAVPLVHMLVFGDLLPEACFISMYFTGTFSTAVGRDDEDAILLADLSCRDSNHTKKQNDESQDQAITRNNNHNTGHKMASPMKPPPVSCDHCRKLLFDNRLNLPVCGSSSLSPAQWCTRCRLAPFCGPECELEGWSEHRSVCMNSDGSPEA